MERSASGTLLDTFHGVQAPGASSEFELDISSSRFAHHSTQPWSSSYLLGNSETDTTLNIDHPEDAFIDWNAFCRSDTADDSSNHEADKTILEPGQIDPLPKLCEDVNAEQRGLQDVRQTIESIEEQDVIRLPDLDDLNFHDPEFMRRQLRPQTRNKRAFETTWMDTDKTENYDPVEDERQPRLKKRRIIAPRSRKPAPNVDNVPKHSSDCPPRQRPKLLVALKFNLPDNNKKFSRLISALEAAELSEKAGYKLRARAKEPFEHGDYRTEDNIKASHDGIDHTAKPYARGCWGCVHLTGRDGVATCSLVHDEADWPCQMCREDDHDCELIRPPAQKRACENCKGKKAPCSFRTTRNHDRSCNQCLRSGYKCVAGPLKDSLRPRIRIDRDWQTEPLPTRKKGKEKAPEDCLECRQNGNICRYPEMEGAPCSNCNFARLPCTISGEPGQLTPDPEDTYDFAALAARNLPLKQTARQLLPVNTSNKKQKAKGDLRIISTNFSHPIHFNCDESEDENDSTCHFCSCPSLALIGFGLKQEVEVIAWDDNRPFEEAGNGHQGDGIESTRLCTSCTTSRLLVSMCPRHEMRPTTDIAITPAIQEQAITALLDNEAKDLSIFCGLCMSLASYECVAAQDDCSGCGLKLCEACALTLEGVHDGDLQSLLGTIEKGEAEEPEQGFRADQELLKEEGALMRHLKWLSLQ